MSVKQLKPKFETVPVRQPGGELLLMEMAIQCAVDLARERGMRQTEAQLLRSLMALTAEMEGAQPPHAPVPLGAD